MRALIQRVSRASVSVDGAVVGQIGSGLLVLLGVTHGDDPAGAQALARQIFELRVLRGETSIATTPGSQVLAVSQFTLYADTRRGRRPSWSAAAPGDVAAPLFSHFVDHLRALGADVATGVFGADMQVELLNDGPVTLLLEV